MTYQIENGRIVTPFSENERPTFLPGDKVRDVRDSLCKTWRIVRRTAFEMTEQITLREVGNDMNEQTVLANQVVPYLRMVAMSKRIEPPQAKEMK